MNESNLPRATPPFTGQLGKTIAESKAVPLSTVQAAEGAPNVIVI